MKLDKWQEDILKQKGDILLCTGRRVGKTYILARKAVDRCLEKKSGVIVVSLTEDQAMLIIAMARHYTESVNPRMLKKGKYDQTLKQIAFKNGSLIRARAVGNTGDSVRGFEADILIIDEASRMPTRFWIAARPLTLTTAGEIWMASTPFGKQGYYWEQFNKAYNEKRENARFKATYITTEEVINKRPISNDWTEAQRKSALRTLEEEKQSMSDLEYGQEYLGLFLDELRQFFPDEIIDQAMSLNRPERVPDKHNFMGCDLARMGGDAITYEIVHRRESGYCHQIANHVRRYQPTTKTKEDIIDYTKAYKVQKVGIDAGSGSLGVAILDDFLKHPFMKSKIEKIDNRTIMTDKRGEKTQRIRKEDLYNSMLAGMESGHFKLLKDENIRLSLKSVQWEIRDGKMRIFGSDTHIVEGLTRAYELAKNAKLNKVFISYI